MFSLWIIKVVFKRDKRNVLFDSTPIQMKNRKIGIQYLVMMKFLSGKFNTSKLSKEAIDDQVQAFWIDELSANGFVWDQEEFVRVFQTVKIKNYFRRLQKPEAKNLLERLEKKFDEQQVSLLQILTTIFLIFFFLLIKENFMLSR